MQHAKIISKILLSTFILSNCYAWECKKYEGETLCPDVQDIKVFKSIDTDIKTLSIYKFDVDKNGKLDTINVTTPATISINGINLHESSTEDLSQYLVGKKLTKTEKLSSHQNDVEIYKDEFFEIQLDSQIKYLFTVRLYGVLKDGEWEKDDTTRVKIDWSWVNVSEDKDKNFVISTGIDNPTPRIWNYHLKIADNRLILTKIVEQVQNYKDRTYYFKKNFEIKMIDTANNLIDKALNKCKEQRVDGY
ncbi:hypothetical protein [Sulfuricurvum sp.]|uniref:hypothetical protein n=1 Tax=Sulfuricurvum sp. TaxID=2025608 RepID=UPI002631A91A|nr:hypothetical protein [Sulfuricurvum sp.]MDD3597505.1 hypothetical protein [Sulfuricurvum sp.]